MKSICKATAGLALPLSLVIILTAGSVPAAAAKPPSSGPSTTTSTTTTAPALSLSVSSAVARAQSSVTTTVTGKSFPKGTLGTITVAGVSQSIKTTKTGTFSASVSVPTTVEGPVNITAKVGTVSSTTVFNVTAAPPAVVHQLKFGVTTPSTSAAELDAVTTQAGEAPSLVVSYQDWKQPVPLSTLSTIDSRGATPVLTWEPWQWGATDQSAYALDTITAGNHDVYINQWAQGLKSYNKPVMLRFAHEMNSDWYPWAEGVNGNGSGDYVAAWKHVHNIFKANGVTNVQWVWNPNVPYFGSTDYAALYPGAEYVDIVALDGYNWGTTQSWGSTWQSPSQVFGEGLTQLRAIAPGKEILIAETASAEVGGDKAAWNRELISYLDAQSDVIGFVWFDHNKEVDWKISSSSTSLSAFKASLAERE